MTKMIVERAVLQQTLEALEGIATALREEDVLGRDVELLLDAGTNLRTVLAQPAQEPECRDDGMPTSAEERHLRRLLALRAAMPHTYYDDDEAQGQEHGITIDFMREPVAHIDAKLRALNVARAECSRPPRDEALRLAVERTRADLGPHGTNYPDVRKLLAFAERAIQCGQA